MIRKKKTVKTTATQRRVRSGKAKGRRLQKWVAEQAAALTGCSCGKDCDIESRAMGQNGVDVRLSERARKLFPFSVECKSQECKLKILWDWVEQSRKNQYKDTDWMLVIKKARTAPVVVIDAETFFNILREKRCVCQNSSS